MEQSAKSKDHSTLTGGIAMLLIGAALLLYNLGLIEFRLGDLAPLVIVFAGIQVISKGFDYSKASNRKTDVV
jgi:hypothetical protein